MYLISCRMLFFIVHCTANLELKLRSISSNLDREKHVLLRNSAIVMLSRRTGVSDQLVCC